MKNEIWRDIEGYKGSYMVSNLGRIKSVDRERKNRFSYLIRTGVVLKKYNSRCGYPMVTLTYLCLRKTLSVHRLVAKAFIPNKDNKPQVNHKDGNKTNNNVENLEWVTNGENQLHAFQMGLNKIKTGIGNKKNIPVWQCDSGGNTIRLWCSVAEAGRNLKIQRTNIHKFLRGERNSVGGFYFKKYE